MCLARKTVKEYSPPLTLKVPRTGWKVVRVDPRQPDLLFSAWSFHDGFCGDETRVTKFQKNIWIRDTNWRLSEGFYIFVRKMDAVNYQRCILVTHKDHCAGVTLHVKKVEYNDIVAQGYQINSSSHGDLKLKTMVARSIKFV